MAGSPSHISRLDGVAAEPTPAGASSTEAPELLQSRLRLFALLMGALFSTLYVGGLIITLLFHRDLLVQIHLHPSKLINLGMAAGVLGVYLLLRRPGYSPAALRGVDVGLTLGIIFGSVAAVVAFPVGYVVLAVALLLMAITLTLRAALVPSPPRRTTALGLVTALPMAYAGNTLAKGDPELPMLLSPFIVTVVALVWSGAVTAVTTITSREIYGLQRQVRDALRLGQYTLLEKLGEGGMGVVYRARHAMLRRPTAVKLLPPHRAGAASLARFEREVQLTSMLTHPNTIAIYDYGRATDGVFYYAMEYVDGVSLEDLVTGDGPQTPARVVHVLRQVAGALGEAHRVGLIHRDVKPANILLCDRGGVPDTVKVVDFGLVKQLEGPADAQVTQADSITGTPAYLAPEMITTPESVDGRADLYALGCVGYFMLTGHTVFGGNSVVEVCGHHLHTRPEPPSVRRGEAVDAGLEQLILDCLAKRPADRPGSAEQLEARLAELAAHHTWTTASAQAWWTEWRGSHPSQSPDVATAMATTVQS